MKNKKIIFIGIVAGLICGLFGSGGGLILVPAFIYFLDMKDTKARGTAVACMLPMVITSGVFYYQDNYIKWNIAILCALGGILGGIVGANLLKKLKTKYVRVIFIIFLVFVSIKMLVN